MLLKKLHDSPEKALRVGLMLVVFGLMMIVLGVLWPRIPFLEQLWPAWNDFLHGFVFGVAIVFEIAGVVINTTTAANKRKAL
jgi:MFS superfamily sulfate permease-like transporter